MSSASAVSVLFAKLMESTSNQDPWGRPRDVSSLLHLKNLSLLILLPQDISECNKV